MKVSQLEPLASPSDEDLIAVTDVSAGATKKTTFGDLKAAIGGGGGDASTWLEWWDPVWTPLSNVDSVANVECSYTRVHRASGGSLVTLEGTITVEIDDDDASTILLAPLPVPATSTGTLLAPAIGVDLSRGDRAVCGAVVTDLGSGPVLAIDAGALANATGVPATLTIGFRISYRAA